MRRQIQVANLSDSINNSSLAELFAPFGRVLQAVVATHHDSGRSTGTGLVDMAQHGDGNAAVAALNGRKVNGLELTVCWQMFAQEADAGVAVGPVAGDFGDRGGADSNGD